MNIAVITLLLDGPPVDGPATVEGALTWKEQFQLEHVSVLVDPGFSLVPGNEVGTPQATVVDPRTMQVAFLQEGYSGSYGPLLTIAEQNAAQ